MKYVVILLTVLVGIFVYFLGSYMNASPDVPEPSVQNVTLSGTYVCLPLIDSVEEDVDNCRFGFKADDGIYYAVNFGQSAQSIALFNRRARITVEGFIVLKETLSSGEWQKYNMRGIFTVTRIIESVP
jgi:hypothetical protein